MKETAGTLLYRFENNILQVLLVHPSGNYNKKAPWSIPKGLPESGEALEEAARRETVEEAGVLAGELTAHGYIDYTKSKKRVHCFYGVAPVDAEPRCASWEVDQAKFLPIDEALLLIHHEQADFLRRLVALLESQK
ncbi:MAG TPA: NUDIX domain-containing protein [Oculatellaceae cyanobacterium]